MESVLHWFIRLEEIGTRVMKIVGACDDFQGGETQCERRLT